jgi:hypothetical protein
MIPKTAEVPLTLPPPRSSQHLSAWESGLHVVLNVEHSDSSKSSALNSSNAFNAQAEGRPWTTAYDFERRPVGT